MANPRVEGLAGLLANIKQVGLNVVRESVGATAAGARVIAKQAKVNAKAHGLVASGALVKNIAIKRDKGAKAQTVQYNIGVRHGRHARKTERIAQRSKSGGITYRYINDPFYWWFWELGHNNPRTKKFEKKPFIAPAIEGKQKESIQAMRDRLRKSIDKYTQKSLARIGR